MKAEQEPSGESPSTVMPPEIAPGPVPTTTPGVAKADQLFASIHPGLDCPLPDSCNAFAKAVLDYEKITGIPAWVIVQSDTGMEEMDNISDELAESIIGAK